MGTTQTTTGGIAQSQGVVSTAGPKPGRYVEGLAQKHADLGAENFYSLFSFNKFEEMTPEKLKLLDSRYRLLLRQYHPDKHTNCSGAQKEHFEAMCVKLALAKKTLSTPDHKRRYDLELGKSASGWPWYARWGVAILSTMGGAACIIAGVVAVPVASAAAIGLSVGGSSLLCAGIKTSIKQATDPNCSDAEFLKDGAIGALSGAAGGGIGVAAAGCMAGASGAACLGHAAWSGAASAASSQLLEDGANLFINKNLRGLADQCSDLKSDEEIKSWANVARIAKTAAIGAAAGVAVQGIANAYAAQDAAKAAELVDDVANQAAANGQKVAKYAEEILDDARQTALKIKDALEEVSYAQEFGRAMVKGCADNGTKLVGETLVETAIKVGIEGKEFDASLQQTFGAAATNAVVGVGFTAALGGHVSALGATRAKQEGLGKLLEKAEAEVAALEVAAAKAAKMTITPTTSVAAGKEWTQGKLISDSKGITSRKEAQRFLADRTRQAERCVSNRNRDTIDVAAHRDATTEDRLIREFWGLGRNPKNLPFEDGVASMPVQSNPRSAASQAGSTDVDVKSGPIIDLSQTDCDAVVPIIRPAMDNVVAANSDAFAEALQQQGRRVLLCDASPAQFGGHELVLIDNGSAGAAKIVEHVLKSTHEAPIIMVCCDGAHPDIGPVIAREAGVSVLAAHGEVSATSKVPWTRFDPAGGTEPDVFTGSAFDICGISPQTDMQIPPLGSISNRLELHTACCIAVTVPHDQEQSIDTIVDLMKSKLPDSTLQFNMNGNDDISSNRTCLEVNRLGYRVKADEDLTKVQGMLMKVVGWIDEHRGGLEVYNNTHDQTPATTPGAHQKLCDGHAERVQWAKHLLMAEPFIVLAEQYEAVGMTNEANDYWESARILASQPIAISAPCCCNCQLFFSAVSETKYDFLLPSKLYAEWPVMSDGSSTKFGWVHPKDFTCGQHEGCFEQLSGSNQLKRAGQLGVAALGEPLELLECRSRFYGTGKAIYPCVRDDDIVAPLPEGQ